MDNSIRSADKFLLKMFLDEVERAPRLVINTRYLNAGERAIVNATINQSAI